MSEYPTPFIPSVRSAGKTHKGPFKGIIFRLLNPSEDNGLHQAECLHAHATMSEAMQCAKTAADSQNLPR